MVQEVFIEIDGACSGQGKPFARAGWSFVVKQDNQTIFRDYGRVTEGTQDSNRAETQALLEALRWAENNPGIILNFRTDSSSLLDGISLRTARRSNRDLWHGISELMEKNAYRIRSVKWMEREQNDEADKYAKMACTCILSFGMSGEVKEFNMDLIKQDLH